MTQVGLPYVYLFVLIFHLILLVHVSLRVNLRQLLAETSTSSTAGEGMCVWHDRHDSYHWLSQCQRLLYNTVRHNAACGCFWDMYRKLGWLAQDGETAHWVVGAMWWLRIQTAASGSASMQV